MVSRGVTSKCHLMVSPGAEAVYASDRTTRGSNVRISGDAMCARRFHRRSSEDKTTSKDCFNHLAATDCDAADYDHVLHEEQTHCAVLRKAFMLALSYSVVYGTAVLLANKTSFVLDAFLQEQYNFNISQVKWVAVNGLFGLVGLVFSWLFVFHVYLRKYDEDGIEESAAAKDICRGKLDQLGEMTLVSESTVGFFVVILAFLLPSDLHNFELKNRILKWNDVYHKMPWGVIFVMSGNIAISYALVPPNVGSAVSRRTRALEEESKSASDRHCAVLRKAFMLALSYSVVYGTAVLLANKTSFVLDAFLQEQYNFNISQVKWVAVNGLFGLVGLVFSWLFVFHVYLRKYDEDGIEESAAAKDICRGKLDQLGEMTLVSESTVGFFVVILAFLLPSDLHNFELKNRILKWNDVYHKMPWGVIFVMSGNIAISYALVYNFNISQVKWVAVNGLFGLVGLVFSWLFVFHVYLRKYSLESRIEAQGSHKLKQISHRSDEDGIEESAAAKDICRGKLDQLGEMTLVSESTVGFFVVILAFLLPSDLHNFELKNRILKWNDVYHKMPWGVIFVMSGNIAISYALVVRFLGVQGRHPSKDIR
ncbi:sodium-dependent dicarboxylate transporter SdcS-like [Ixodes scapularis]